MFDNHIARIKSVKWDEKDINGRVEIETSAGTFSVARKDFWGAFDVDWKEELTPGTNLRVWTIQGSRIAAFEYLKPISNEWFGVWYVGNHFDTKEESEKKMQAYVDFIKNEGDKIADLIDKGSTFEMIQEALDEGHTGNTVAMAFGHGLNTAKDKGRADVIRQSFNLYFGVSETQADGGLVNPAIIKIPTGEKTDEPGKD